MVIKECARDSARRRRCCGPVVIVVIVVVVIALFEKNRKTHALTKSTAAADAPLRVTYGELGGWPRFNSRCEGNFNMLQTDKVRSPAAAASFLFVTEQTTKRMKQQSREKY